MFCFEVQLNGEQALIAGAQGISVLTVMATYVASHQEAEFHVGGLIHISESGREDVEWVKRPLGIGDHIIIRVVDVQQPSEPIARSKQDPNFVEKQKRQYYERLKKEYGDVDK